MTATARALAPRDAALVAAPLRRAAPVAPVVDVVVPVHNEAAGLERSIRRLDTFLAADFPFAARITVVDNASTDATWAIAHRLRRELSQLRIVHLDEKGRGRALRTAWLTSDAPVVAYMDVDLSTDLRALLPLVAPLISGHSDLAIGSRLLPGSRVVRGAKREVISRTYNLLLRATLQTRFRDAQCGFKAMRTEVARRLLPRVRDEQWFFDTELLILAERAGLRIHEVPVDWTDDPDSRVDITSTALGDLRGIVRVARSLVSGRVLAGLEDLRRVTPRPAMTLARQAAVFGLIGVVSTAAYVVLYLLLRAVLAAPVANAVTLLVTAIGNTAANRRLTFGVRGRAHIAQHHTAGLIAFGIALAMTSGALGALRLTDPHAGRVTEVVVLCASSALATAVRFLLLREAMQRSVRAAASPAS
jgi:putative flippase GtrA